VRQIMEKEGIIFVGTCSSDGIPNVSPYTAFVVTGDNRLLWATWFKHKTYRNELESNHVSVAVVDSEKLVGYQMKGHIELVSDPMKVMEIMLDLTMKPRHANFNKIIQSQLRDPSLIIRFVLERLFSLDPDEASKNPLPLSQE